MKVFSLILLYALTACTSEIDRLIPASQLSGAVQNINVTIKGQPDKCTAASDDSVYIKAIGIVPFEIKREQVRPTLLAVFKGVKTKYSNCEKFFIELAPAQEMAETGHLVGRTDY